MITTKPRRIAPAPAVFDARLFAETMAIIKELRRLGLKPPEPRVVSPYGHPVPRRH